LIRRGSRICSSILVLCAATVATAWVPGALAQDYPNRSIRLLVGFPAGGPSDVPARIIAKKMQVALGQPVVVENKTGAAGMIGRQPVLHRSSALHGGSVRCASLIAPYA
jgi:tripartite-type tricarboxylate transporter receptor subunit TctC